MKLERIQAPSGGMNSEASPDYVPANQAPLLVNMLPGRAGKAVLRGGLTKYYNGVTNLTSHGNADGTQGPFVWSYDDALLVRTAGMSANTAADWWPADGTATLVQPGFTIKSSVHTRVQDCIYGDVPNAVGSSTIGRWQPGGMLVRYANAPTRFTALKGHQQRLFVLGGAAAGASLYEPRALFWSDPIAIGSPLGGGVDAWQDDVSGLTNRIVFAEADMPVALAKAGRWLVILMTRSIYVMTGDAPANWAVRRLTSEFGCLDAQSVVESDDGFFFLSDRGYCFCDGSEVRVVSGAINSSLLAARPGAAATPVTAAMLPGGYILVAVTASAPALASLFLYHIDTGTWTRLDSPLLASRNWRVYRTATSVFLHDGYFFVDASYLTRPETQAALTPNTAGQDSDGAASPTRYTIVPKWYSRLARLGAPGQMAHVKRILLDFVLKAESTSRAGLRVELHDGYGNLLGSTMTTANARTDANRQRFQSELYVETDTIQLQVSRDQETAVGGTPPGITALEFLDAAVEFDDGRSRPAR